LEISLNSQVDVGVTGVMGGSESGIGLQSDLSSWRIKAANSVTEK